MDLLHAHFQKITKSVKFCNVQPTRYKEGSLISTKAMFLTGRPLGQIHHSYFEDTVKGTHTIYFSSSLYIINQKPTVPRTHFHCIPTWVASSSV